MNRYLALKRPLDRRVVLNVIHFEPFLTCSSTTLRALAGAPATEPLKVTVWPLRSACLLTPRLIFATTWRLMSVVEANVASSLCVRYAKRMVRERTAVVV